MNTQVSGLTIYTQPRTCDQFDQNAASVVVIRDAVAQLQLDYDSAETYSTNNVVLYLGNFYQSLVDNNLNNIPSSSPTQWQAITSAEAATNLGLANQTATGLDITSSSGLDVSVPLATDSLAGLMSAADKTTLDGLGGVGSTNLSIANSGANTLDVASDTGTDATIPAATGANAGLLTAADKTKLDGLSGGSIPSQDNLASGVVTADVDRDGSSAVTISNPASGEYDLTIPSGSYFRRATVFGNNTTVNGSSEFILRINNSANTANRRVIVQLYDANNETLVDQQVTGTVHTQVVAGNITTLTFPGVVNFGAPGFYVEIS